MRRFTLTAMAAVGLAAMVFAAGGSAGTSQTPKRGGTVVFAAEQEPPCLNTGLAGCNNTWTSWTAGTATRGLYILKPDFSAVPDIADGEGQIVKRSPFTLRFKIKQKAVWSDGVPVTGKDVAFTWRTFINPKNDVASRSGYDSIRSVSGTGKTVTVVFKKPFAPWKQLFANPLYPAHALTGTDFNTVWNESFKNKSGQNISNGPFVLQSYVKGQSITMVRNNRWWGPHKPYLDKVVFVFRTNTDTEIQAIRGGEVDVIYPQPQLQLADLKGQAGLKVVSSAGTTLEHIDFNSQLKGGMPLLRAPWFRQAISYSIDRTAMVKQLFRTLNPTLTPLQNLTYANSQKGLYKPHFEAYKYSPAKVTQIMQKHGCTKGSDGIWSCGGVKAAIKFGTTAGNRLRELALEIMQAQAKNAGFQFIPDSEPSRLFFPRVSDGNYQMALFAWVGSGDPYGQTDIYGCGGESNWKGYCSNKVTKLLRDSDAELDPKKRAALVNTADAIMALNVPTLPLYQKPTYLVHKTKIRGIRDNPTNQGPTDNMEDWWISS